MRADRLLSIMMLLQTRGRMSAGQMARELEVSERTIYRDIAALGTIGIPIYAEAGAEGGYQLLDSYHTDLTGLSEGEVRALFMLNMPGPLEKLGLGQELKAAMLKLTAALPGSRQQDEERVRQRYVVDSSWSSQTEGPVPHLKTIQQAVWEDRRLVITYNPLFDVQIERVVDPYGLAARSGAWHLVFARGGRVRVRRVADLQTVNLTPEKFERPAGFDLGEFWKRWCAEEEQNLSRYPVTVRVTKKALPSIIRRFGASISAQLAHAPELDDGSRVLILYFRWVDEARENLLPFGGGLEVLEPYELRASIADIAGQINGLYRK